VTGGAGRRHGGRPDKISPLIDALGDLEDLHVRIMDVISAPPPDERPGRLATQVQAEAMRIEEAYSGVTLVE